MNMYRRQVEDAERRELLQRDVDGRPMHAQMEDDERAKVILVPLVTNRLKQTQFWQQNSHGLVGYLQADWMAPGGYLVPLPPESPWV